MSAIASPAVAYCDCLEDIKQRLAKVSRILLGHSPMKHEGLDAEVVFLLLRKSLEQIAFSSLIAHKDIYEKVHADFAKTWRVKKLLERLEDIHPNFYPKPVDGPSVDEKGIRHFLDVKEGFLTRDEFVFLYDKCSEVLHTWNPFRQDPRVVHTARPMAEWVQRIHRLLNIHYVQLVDMDEVWLVEMHNAVDGKVHAYPATSPPPGAAP
ncbi:MAG: hypothetical protein ACK5RK_15495 [Betaproteobacteria bacterium]